MEAPQQFQRPPLAALVYRANKGCQQYAFGSVDDLAAWAARHPYRNETLRVMAVRDGKYVGDAWMPATEAAEFARKVGAGETAVEGHNAKVRGTPAALSPEAPSRLPGSGTGDK